MFGSDLFLFLSVRVQRDEFSYLIRHTTLTESEMPTFLDTGARLDLALQGFIVSSVVCVGPAPESSPRPQVSQDSTTPYKKLITRWDRSWESALSLNSQPLLFDDCVVCFPLALI